MLKKIASIILLSSLLFTGCSVKNSQFDKELKDYTNSQLNKNLRQNFSTNPLEESISANFSDNEFKKISLFLLIFNNKLALDINYKNKFPNLQPTDKIIFKSDNMTLEVSGFLMNNNKSTIFPLGDMYLPIRSLDGVQVIKNFAKSEHNQIILTDKNDNSKHIINISSRENKGLLLMLEHIYRNLWS